MSFFIEPNYYSVWFVFLLQYLRGTQNRNSEQEGRVDIQDANSGPGDSEKTECQAHIS